MAVSMLFVLIRTLYNSPHYKDLNVGYLKIYDGCKHVLCFNPYPIKQPAIKNCNVGYLKIYDGCKHALCFDPYPLKQPAIKNCNVE